jgi:hypothetical protein
MIEISVCLFQHQFAVCFVSSKTAGKKVTFSFSGAFRFTRRGLFWSPIQYMLQPMKKMKIKAGRSRSAMVFLRLRFLIGKFAPGYLLCRWQDKL